MLIGEYSHSIDEKGRMSFPVKFREELGDEFYVTRWLDECLVVFAAESFAEMTKKLTEQSKVKSREIRRFLYAGAVQAQPDRQGRILLPAHLRAHAGLDKDAVVVGAGDYAEIWAPGAWAAEMDRLRNGPMEEMMAELDF